MTKKSQFFLDFFIKKIMETDFPAIAKYLTTKSVFSHPYHEPSQDLYEVLRDDIGGGYDKIGHLVVGKKLFLLFF